MHANGAQAKKKTQVVSGNGFGYRYNIATKITGSFERERERENFDWVFPSRVGFAATEHAQPGLQSL